MLKIKICCMKVLGIFFIFYFGVWKVLGLKKVKGKPIIDQVHE